MTAIEVLAAGWATSVQDAGRPGFAALGVSRSGAVDTDERALLNRLVGNDEAAAVLETLGGLRVRTTAAAVVATSGELVATAVAAGALIDVEPAPDALWGYLAVRGGIAVDPVLGSRSRDSRSGLGPPPVTVGDILAVGPDPRTPLVADRGVRRPSPDVVAVWPGPRATWLAPGSLDVLTGASWTVSPDVSRVGVRLDGGSIERARHDELPSEGLVLGAVQVPPDGRPVVMLADHPTTGGYPVLAVVDPSSLAAVVRARPGSTLRFRVVQ